MGIIFSQPDYRLRAVSRHSRGYLTLPFILLTFHGPLLEGLVLWREFFEELRNVKVLRLHHDLATEVTDMLRQPTVNPSRPQEEVAPDVTTTTSSGPTMNSSSRIFGLDTSH